MSVSLTEQGSQVSPTSILVGKKTSSPQLSHSVVSECTYTKEQLVAGCFPVTVVTGSASLSCQAIDSSPSFSTVTRPSQLSPVPVTVASQLSPAPVTVASQLSPVPVTVAIQMPYSGINQAEESFQLTQPSLTSTPSIIEASASSQHVVALEFSPDALVSAVASASEHSVMSCISVPPSTSASSHASSSSESLQPFH